MKVTFKLFKDDYSWDGVIHQINSDILKRHVLVNGNLPSMNVRFSYCESTAIGIITDQHESILGEFLIWS